MKPPVAATAYPVTMGASIPKTLPPKIRKLIAVPAREPFGSRSLVSAMFMPIAVDTQVKEMLNSARSSQVEVTNGVMKMTEDASSDAEINVLRPPPAWVPRLFTSRSLNRPRTSPSTTATAYGTAVKALDFSTSRPRVVSR